MNAVKATRSIPWQSGSPGPYRPTPIPDGSPATLHSNFYLFDGVCRPFYHRVDQWVSKPSPGGVGEPTLVTAKERARRVNCKNSERQFLLAVHLYGDDNQQRLPSGEDYPEAKTRFHAELEPLVKINGFTPVYVNDANGLNHYKIYVYAATGMSRLVDRW